MDVTLNKGMISIRSPISFDELASPERMENQAIASILVKDMSNQHKSIVASCQRRNSSSADESLYISESDLVGLLHTAESQKHNERIPSEHLVDNNVAGTVCEHLPSDRKPLPDSAIPKTCASMWYTAKHITGRCFQPPAIGAIAGITCAFFPRLRGLFVDIVDRDSSAPLQFLFDGLYAISTAAVPINMMILGCNLSSSSSSRTSPLSTTTLSMATMVGILIGKMVLMPFIGILSAIFLKNYAWDIPDDIDGSFYLALMVVFLTPTANNVVVMVELSGSGAEESMARVIVLQYLFAPIVLTVTMTIAIGVASEWM